MEMPRPTESHKQLHRLAGKGTGEEKLSHSPAGPPAITRGRYEMRVDIDGFFVLQDYVQERDGQISYRGHGVFGWDAEKKTYTWFWVDSMGFVPPSPSRGQWTGDTLVFEHAPMGEHGERRGRYTYKFPAENTF